MKKFLKTLAVFAAVATLGFGFASCADDDDGGSGSGSGSALVAHNDDELLNILNSIQKDPCVLNDYANKKYEFAIKKHSASTLIPRLKELV